MTTFFGLLGTVQGLLLALAIASVGGKSGRPNRALGLVILCLSAAVGAITVDHAELFDPTATPFLFVLPILVEHTATFLFAPAFWHYTNLVLGDRPKTPLWVHCLPLAAWLTYLLSFTLGWVTWRWLPPVLLVLSYLIGYTVAIATRLLRNASRSKTLVHHAKVLKLVLLALVALHGAQLVRFLFRDVEALRSVVPVTATLAIFLLAIVSFRQSRLFVGLEANPMRRKYAASNLTAKAAAELEERLAQILEQEKPYLNESLTLAELAERLKVPRAHLSQVVNRNLGLRFAELVRRCRVEEAHRLLGDSSYEHLTIEAIGYEVGFASRSSFHTAYKNLRNETPAQARSRLLPNAFEDNSTHDGH